VTRPISRSALIFCLCAAAVALLLWAVAPDGAPAGEALPGQWFPAPPQARGPELTDEQKEAIRRLNGLGYLKGYTPDLGRQTITHYDSERTSRGLNLCFSGHAPEAVLMDMEGDVLHRWSVEFDDVEAWDGVPDRAPYPGQDFWRRGHLYENGDLLALHGGFLVKLNKDSKILWTYHAYVHHDLFVDDRGLIYVLGRKGWVVPRIHPTEPILEEYIITLDPEGKELHRARVFEAFENSDYASVLERLPEHGDLFHPNTIEILDGSLADRSPLFRRGHALVSLLNIDTVAIVDLERERVVWSLSDLWHRQHDPTLLPGGTMLVFDNLGNVGYSRILEIDPLSEKTVWSYQGDPPESFFSGGRGACRRLPNGNTLVVESDRGRALELTRGGEIVWEFYNPHRAGANDELIATLFDVVRLSPDFPQFFAFDTPRGQ
jgi:hypothetical protein